jgi:cell wall-associated NlpC family hydrolase
MLRRITTRIAIAVLAFATVAPAAFIASPAEAAPQKQAQPLEIMLVMNALSEAPSQAAKVAVLYALSQHGKQYTQAANRRLGQRVDGYDCSGLVWRSYFQAGVWLGGSLRYTQSIRTDRRIYRIAPQQVRAGDLVFFTFSRSRPNGHMAIALGNNWMIEASSSSGYVKITNYAAYANKVSGYYRVFAE